MSSKNLKISLVILLAIVLAAVSGWIAGRAHYERNMTDAQIERELSLTVDKASSLAAIYAKRKAPVVVTDASADPHGDPGLPVESQR